MFERVAVAVVEGDGDEAALAGGAVEPPPGLVHGNDVDIGLAERGEHRIEKGRRDFETTLRLEGFVMRRQHPVEGEDRAHSGKEGPRQAVRAGEIEGLEAGSDGPSSHVRHGMLLVLTA